jgi:hypothetical protein
MPMTMQEYSRLADLVNYGVRIFRRLSFAFDYPDVSPIITIDDYLDRSGDARFSHYFYPVVRNIRKRFGGNLEFVFDSEVSNLFYAIRNYLSSYYQTTSLGKIARDDLGIHIHNISSDYQLIHSKLFGFEDLGYYKIFGRIPISISLIGESSRYTGHNAYNLSYNLTEYENDGLKANRSYIPTKYWGEYYFLIKNAVPDSFYARTDVITPTGNIMDVYYQFSRQTSQSITNISTFVNNSNSDVLSFGSSVYKPTNFGTVDGSVPPSGSKIAVIKELHIPNTYTYTADDILLFSAKSSDFYTGTELFSPDQLYQLPLITT